MVTEWLCPHCGRKFYSANESKDRPLVECANCGEQVTNSCFQGEQGEQGEQKEQGLRTLEAKCEFQTGLWTTMAVKFV